MPHITLEEHLPGITGVLEYRKDRAAPIRALTQFLLRGPSALTEGNSLLLSFARLALALCQAFSGILNQLTT